MYTYGYARAEILGAFANSVLLCSLSMSVVVNALERFLEPEPITNPKLMVVVGGIGLLVNVVSLLMLFEYGGFGKARHEQEIEQARELLGGRRLANEDEDGDADTDAFGGEGARDSTEPDAYVEALSRPQSGLESPEEGDGDGDGDCDGLRLNQPVQVLLVPQVVPGGSSAQLVAPIFAASDTSLASDEQSKPAPLHTSPRDSTQTPRMSEFATAASSPRESPIKSLPELANVNKSVALETIAADADADAFATQVEADGRAQVCAAEARPLVAAGGVRERRKHAARPSHSHAHGRGRARGHGHSHFGGHGHAHHAGNMNIRGVLFHVMGDALGSCIVVLCAGIVWFFRDHLAAQALAQEQAAAGAAGASAAANVTCETLEPEHIFKRHWTSYLDPSLSCFLASILCYAGVSLCAPAPLHLLHLNRSHSTQ